ncbi:hypothetical protein [Leptospira yasudae]|uniref:hypothetical protein n=1 Tax=Leptospira yasudae TaxID=2202201 RepID=UPI001AEFE739|nr:hypothetical protein [Leptospira yasudae]
MNNEQIKNTQNMIFDLKSILGLDDKSVNQSLQWALTQYKNYIPSFIKVLEITISANLPHNIETSILAYAGLFGKPAKSLLRLLDNTNPRPYNEIIVEMDEAITLINQFTVNPNIGGIPYPPLSTYILSLDSSKAQEVESIITKLKSQEDETNSLLEGLRKELAQLSIEKYASIFRKQSLKHSRIFETNGVDEGRFSYFKIGASELWLVFGLILLIMLPAYLINNFNSDILIYKETEFSLKYISWYSVRIVILSSWIYIVKICFKNYNSNKLLSTINSHRENVLNSFRLLSELIPKENVEARIELLKEIMRNTYFAGEIPYSDEKSDGIKVDAIIELIKKIKLS